MKCEFCNKECKNANSHKQHSIRCKLNPNRIFVVPSRGMLGKKGKNQFTKAEELGLPKPIVSEETKKKLSDRQMGELNHWSINSSEKRENHSLVMQAVVKENPESYSSSNVCGRVRVIEYKGQRLHGNWELTVAKWFDDNDISWVRPTDPIPYQWKGKWHLYFPDFYLPNYDVFVEVKGYETERDKCKWASTPNLLTIKGADIKMIKSGNFVLGV